MTHHAIDTVRTHTPWPTLNKTGLVYRDSTFRLRIVHSPISYILYNRMRATPRASTPHLHTTHEEESAGPRPPSNIKSIRLRRLSIPIYSG